MQEPRPVPSPVDWLGVMMTDQGRLQAIVEPKVRSVVAEGHADRDVFYLWVNAVGLAGEAFEMMQSLPTKIHKVDYGRSPTAAELSHAKEEAVDCLIYLLNVFHGLGVNTSHEVYTLFEAKAGVNLKRQADGY